MTRYIDQHTHAILACCTSCLELLCNLPETDLVCEIVDILQAQFDIIECTINNRHFGSDALDEIIDICNKVIFEVKELEEK